MEMNNSLGSWAFILGVLIAIVSGLASGALVGYAWMISAVLVILGLIVGFLNIGAKEKNDFLIAAIALGLLQAAHLGEIPMLGGYLASMVVNVAAFVAPAALVVALKAIYAMGRKPAS